MRDRGPARRTLACYDRALELKPDESSAFSHRGNTLKDQGRLEEAVANYRRALELNPDDRGTHSSLLFTLNF